MTATAVQRDDGERRRKNRTARHGEDGERPAPAAQVENTVSSVVEVELRERAPSTPGAWLAEHITGFSGSLVFVAMNAVWFAIWILWNSRLFGLPTFDPYPYSFLTFAVSLEAIFLATFVLISQNRQSARADRRSMVDLQVNVIAERELTKILEMVADIHNHVSENTKPDPEVDDMLKRVDVEDLERVTAKAEETAKRS